MQLELHLKIVLYVVIDQPEQADERLRIVEGRIDRRHLLIGRAGLVRDPERGIGAEHIGKAARRPVIAQLMEQLEQTARVARHGDVLPEIRAALLLEPALRAQLADEKARASGNIAQLVFVDVLALEGRVRELLLQTAAQHGVQLVLGQPELLPVCHAEHIERVRVQRPVRGRERREQLVRHGFKKFHKRYPPAEGALPLVFRLIQLYGFRADFTMCSLSEKSLSTQRQSGLRRQGAQGRDCAARSPAELPQSALGGRIRKTKAARRPRFADSRPFPEEHPRQSPAPEAASTSISS